MEGSEVRLVADTEIGVQAGDGSEVVQLTGRPLGTGLIGERRCADIYKKKPKRITS